MCGIAGFCNFNTDYTETSDRWSNILQHMNKVQSHRGPDESGTFLSPHCGFGHTRLSVIDLQTGTQPVTRQIDGHKATITFNGEIYNMNFLKRHLMNEGASFMTRSDTEVVLTGYLLHGISFISELNGVFAFAIWDETLQILFVFRDRLGVKPLFYTTSTYDKTFVFSSELKGLFSYPDIIPRLDKTGLCEIFGLGPARTAGNGIFMGIRELLPGQYIRLSRDSLSTTAYWKLTSCPHEDSFSTTVEKTHFLITDAIKKQMLSDVPICTFLSGGVDSSLVTSVCSQEMKHNNKKLATYSFDFKNNDLNFFSNDFQPSLDRPWVDKMVAYADTEHTCLECDNTHLYEYLYRAVDARDLPCMADVESSMLYFCEAVSKRHKVALTGECADEIFGGYPWFHKEECLAADTFPWSMDFDTRTLLFKDDILSVLPLREYVHSAYEKTVSDTPVLPGESPAEKRRREISYMNIKWFMQTLLERMDRAGMYSGLEARVPFADHRLVEYLWNVPWSMKAPNGIVKGLLRETGYEHLPYDVLYRKKSPYPKTYDPAYENLLKSKIREVMYDTGSPLSELLDKNKTEHYLSGSSDYSRPFYGQLMAGPQLLAYLLQVNYWLKKFRLNISDGIEK